MTKETLCLRSTVRTSLQKRLLWRGTLMGALGMAIIIYAATSMSGERLGQWGPLILASGVALIALGLRPYRKVTRLLLDPYEIVVSMDEFTFRHQGTALFTTPFQAVKEMMFFDAPSRYGIGIHLQEDKEVKIQVQDEQFNMKQFIDRSQKDQGQDLFFPFFSESAFNELHDHVFAEDD